VFVGVGSKSVSRSLGVEVEEEGASLQGSYAPNMGLGFVNV